jgi:hypothetical protein
MLCVASRRRRRRRLWVRSEPRTFQAAPPNLTTTTTCSRVVPARAFQVVNDGDASRRRRRRVHAWSRPRALQAADGDNEAAFMRGPSPAPSRRRTTATPCVASRRCHLGPQDDDDAAAFSCGPSPAAPGPHDDDAAFVWSRPRAFQVVDDADAGASKRRRRRRLWCSPSPATSRQRHSRPYDGDAVLAVVPVPRLPGNDVRAPLLSPYCNLVSLFVNSHTLL